MNRGAAVAVAGTTRLPAAASNRTARPPKSMVKQHSVAAVDDNGNRCRATA